ncbi:ABC transporter permease subunit [Limimaricola litoreus]|uniref:ABC transporter permease subunit n=1 Tax=Limimaricola litoreus TaxID=2955316 RepID=A0A9X2FWE3_9RHOB|nr:ABC transporter permease subunit [Limimaricola litoreus]MCP1169671.1 ABC transporter permease subunit [Limimaricola litoreus]
MSALLNLSRAWSGRALVVAVPILWLGLFFALPFLVVAKISLSELAIAMPPYLPLAEWADGALNIVLNFGNYLFLLSDGLYIAAYLESLKIAAISTLFTLLIGYPMAYVIAMARPDRRNLLLMLVVLPFWTSFLLRVYAWIGFLKSNGIINNMLMALGITDAPLQLIQTDFAVYIGITYTYLPFMILPLYANLSRLDRSHLEAAADLGARPLTTFLTVTLPQSAGGIVAGCMLVFIPAVGEFVIPALLGGPDTLMIGRVLWDEFFSNRDWPVASAVAVVMLLVLIGPILLLRRAQAREEG